MNTILTYHPINIDLNLINCTPPNDFVKLSTNCKEVLTYCMETVLSRTNDLKWLYLRAACFVQGRIFGAFTRSMQPLFSSKIIQYSIGVLLMEDIIIWNSRSKPVKRITSRIDYDREIYSLFVLEIAMLV